MLLGRLFNHGAKSEMKKILALSSIRSDYDLMSGVYKFLANDNDIDFRFLVSGAHLSSSHGTTVEMIQSDNHKILAELETLIDGDTLSSRLKTASNLLHSSIDVVRLWLPDLIIYAGDREDVLIGGLLGTYLKIPTVHFFGGDHEEDNHADTPIRAATSKLSTAHIVSIEEHKRRLIALGESCQRIFVTGSVALDKFKFEKHNDIQRLKNILPQDKNLKNYALLIFHPLDTQKDTCALHMKNIISVLLEQKISICIGSPNSDPGSFALKEVISEYEGNEKIWYYGNLLREDFLTLYTHADFLIGNSSSGILEAASIPLGVINVGSRQKNRFSPRNVIFCDPSTFAIQAAIEKAQSKGFIKSLRRLNNPYGDGNSCERAYRILKDKDFKLMLNKSEDPLIVNNEINQHGKGEF